MASITKSSDRQYPLVAVATITHADFSGAGAIEIFQVPQNAVITAVRLFLDVNFTAATTFDIGDGGVVDRYTASAPISVAAGAGTSLAGTNITGYKYTAVDTIDVTVNQDASAGSARIVIEYYISDRGNENQG